MRCDMRWTDRILLPIYRYDLGFSVACYSSRRLFYIPPYRKLQFNLTQNILIKKVKRMFVDVEMNYFLNKTKTTEQDQIDLI